MNSHNPFDRGRVGDAVSPQWERPEVDAPATKREIPRYLKIIALILLISLGVYLLYALLVHPANKIKLQATLLRSCRINIEVDRILTKGDLTVKIDGKYIAVGEFNTEYYELDGDKVYKYEKTYGADWETVWKRVELDEQIIVIGDASRGSFDFEDLLDRRNYERVKGKLFVWQIKEGVDTGILEDVKIMRKKGKLTITAKEVGYANSYITITFDRFGRTYVDLPWK